MPSDSTPYSHRIEDVSTTTPAKTNDPTLADDATDSPSRRRRWRRLKIGGIILGGLIFVVYLAVGWYVSGEIIAGLRVVPHVVEYDTEVISLGGGEIVLRVPDESGRASDRDAVMGLRWEGGYGQVGPATGTAADIQTRSFTLLAGEPPTIGPDAVDLDSFAFPNDPTVLGLDVTTVSYPSPLGDLEAWLFPGEGSTWLVAVHGRAADRTEYLRLVDATRELRYPTLVIRYRNDPDSPSTGDSLIRVGQDEYPDVAAAVDFALANGATDVVVYGASMGGGLTLGYALEEDRDVVRGLILEAPAADLREIVQLKSGDALPVGGIIGDSFLAAGRILTTLRTGVDFDDVDYIDRAEGLHVPILLFHGTEDGTIPHAIGEDLASARPDLVEFHSVPDAEHIRAWNEDPDGYTVIVARFLDRIGRSG